MGGLLSVLYTCGLRDALTLPNLPIKCSFETQPVFGPALLSQPVWLFGGIPEGSRFTVGSHAREMAVGRAGRSVDGQAGGKPGGRWLLAGDHEGSDFGEFPGSGVLPSGHFHFN